MKVAEARLSAAQARLEQRDETLRTGGGAAAGNSFVLRAPIAGRVAEVYAALGASYDEGAPLFRIVRTDRVELQALVPASEAPLTEEIREIALEVPGRPEPLVVAGRRTSTTPASSTRRRARCRCSSTSTIAPASC